MQKHTYLCLLILASILLLFAVSTLNTTAADAHAVFVYAQSAATPVP